MKIKQHKESGLWVREDGAVLMPPGGHFYKFRWTFGCQNKYGYMVVTFHGKQYQVHRLIAEAFIPNPEGYKEVDHYPDRTKTMNMVSNLRWADRKMQLRNRQIVDDSIAKYGVRCCDDENAYKRARYAKDPEFAEHCRATGREWRAKNAERERARDRERYAKNRALGRRRRKCPDGSHRWLTDEEYNERYKKSSLMAGNSV